MWSAGRGDSHSRQDRAWNWPSSVHRYLGGHCILTCTEASTPGYAQRRIDKAFLAELTGDFDQHFYVCDPAGFMQAVNTALEDLGARHESLVFER